MPGTRVEWSVSATMTSGAAVSWMTTSVATTDLAAFQRLTSTLVMKNVVQDRPLPE
ncbi:hypothetical protein GCM10009579_88650 [Streptomyces javensis]|uniref:Uncharacterized protein n=1 Tax=Streptomyces javensis TaxID=114698 RepID=A0ABN1XEZ1_9ACTN